MNIQSFEFAFSVRNPDRLQILFLMREAIGVKEVEWKDLTVTNLTAVRDLMLKRYAQNSAQVYCSILKAFLNNVCDEVELPTMRYAKALKVKLIPSQHCCLTEEELIMFDEYKPKSETENDVKILFMRGAFSGAVPVTAALWLLRTFTMAHYRMSARRQRWPLTSRFTPVCLNTLK